MEWPALTPTSQSAHAGSLATVLRRLVAAGSESLDPWLSFPQNGCSYAFGRPPRPLPIGALGILWNEGHPFTQPCPDCAQPLRMIFMGGLLTIGGGRLICAGCAGDFFQSMGPLSTVATILAGSRLQGTEFAPSRLVFGGSVGSDGAELLKALGLSPVHQGEWGVVTRDDGRRTARVLCGLIDARGHDEQACGAGLADPRREGRGQFKGVVHGDGAGPRETR